MSVVPESQASKTRSQLEEYRVKFPEIPEQDLLRIVQKVSPFASKKSVINIDVNHVWNYSYFAIQIMPMRQK